MYLKVRIRLRIINKFKLTRERKKRCVWRRRSKKNGENSNAFACMFMIIVPKYKAMKQKLLLNILMDNVK